MCAGLGFSWLDEPRHEGLREPIVRRYGGTRSCRVPMAALVAAPAVRSGAANPAGVAGRCKGAGHLRAVKSRSLRVGNRGKRGIATICGAADS